MAFPDDYFDNLARMRAMLPAEDQIAKIISDFNRFHEAHGAIVDQLRFPIERSRLYVDQIREIQALARSTAGELSATQAQVRSAAVDLAAAQQLRVNQFQALTSSLRFVDTASLIGERLRNLSIPRSVDFSAYERLIDRHDQIASALAKMTRGADSILAVSDLAEFTIPAASRELVLANYALDAITVEDEGEEPEEEACIHDIRRDGSDLDSLLEQVNPALVRPYRGIKDAMSSGSVDRTRHVLASTRELCNNVLWLLAPTDTVTRWLEGEGLDMLHKGRPTRRGRILYICRRFSEAPLAGFFDADVKAFRELMEVCGRLHQLSPEFSDVQLQAVVLRTECLLRFIIELDSIEN